MLVASTVEKGYISRINALFLVGSWPIYMMITKTISGHGTLKAPDPTQTTKNKRAHHHIIIATLGFIGVAVGAYAVVQSVITLSATLNIPEYIISFFLLAIGTSLPELAVGLTALHKKQYEIVIGDIIGSCIVDASFSIGIGQVFFPQTVSSELASITTLYTIFASLAVIFTLAIWERVDKKAGIIFIALYLLSYTLLII
jgi:cation:H+ antiporter